MRSRKGTAASQASWASVGGSAAPAATAAATAAWLDVCRLQRRNEQLGPHPDMNWQPLVPAADSMGVMWQRSVLASLMGNNASGAVARERTDALLAATLRALARAPPWLPPPESEGAPRSPETGGVLPWPVPRLPMCRLLRQRDGGTGVNDVRCFAEVGE